MSAVLRGLAAVVVDVELARGLYREGFYGRFLGYDKVKREEVDKVNAPLILALYEALYLSERGRFEDCG
jgi:tRNA-intron endonuclease